MAGSHVHERLRKAYTVLRTIMGISAVILIVLGVYQFFILFQSASTRIRDLAVESLHEEGDHRVLFISSYSQTHFTVPQEWRGLEVGFQGQGVVVDTEYMDTKNHPDKASVDRFAALLRGKLQTTHYDALVVGDDAALHFVDDHRADLFPDTPVVFLGINDLAYANQVHEEGWATGIPEETNLRDVFQAAADLFPASKTFAVVVDDTPTGKGDLAQVQQMEGDFPGYQFDIINTSQLSQDQYAQAVGALGTDAIVMELDGFEDADGNVYTIDDTIRFLSSHTDRPIFRASTGGVGDGVLGSGVLDFQEHARQAATMAIQTINGTSPGDIPLVHMNYVRYVFDDQLMRRYGIKDADLPPNSTTLGGAQSFWQEYDDVLMPAAHILSGLILVIIILVVSAAQSSRDAQTLRDREGELRHRLYFDRLTDIVNRNGLFALDDSPFGSAAVFNIDVFKFINERYGHLCGDQILKEIAARLDSLPHARAARLGGDEFFVLFEGGLSQDPGLVDRIDSLLGGDYLYEGERIDVSVSAGFAQRQEGETLDQLLAKTELAMFEGRRDNSHHGFRVYDEGIKERFDHRSVLVSDLQKAVRDRSFTVLYQPQVHTDTRELFGFEALCRFENNKYYPDEFIPIAEESGYIIDLDRIVTQKVIEQLDAWKQAGYRLPVVSINYSSRQLKDLNYDSFVQGLLDEHGIPNDRIKIEITERGVFADQERSIEFFQTTRAMGIEVALDDFGTGYSSITAISKLPVDYVKLDKSLIDDYLVEGRAAFLENLTAIVHDLGKKVVAEGVETEDQYQLARRIGIDQIQGYYFDRPLPPDQAIRVCYEERPV